MEKKSAHIVNGKSQQLDAHLLLPGLAHALDARPLDKVRQVEGRLLEAPLALQVLALGAPVPRHRHRVPRRLQAHQQLGVARRHVLC